MTRRSVFALRAALASAAVAAIALPLVACGGPGRITQTPDASARTQSSPPTSAEWGPLAVARDDVGADFGRTVGTLEISDECVRLLEETGDRLILAWWSEAVRWDTEQAAIVFAARDGGSVTVRDGQRVALGGSGETFAVGSAEQVDRQAWVDSIAWVVPPNRSCDADGAWGVGNVELL
jgi:hypothetical protein